MGNHARVGRDALVRPIRCSAVVAAGLTLATVGRAGPDGPLFDAPKFHAPSALDVALADYEAVIQGLSLQQPGSATARALHLGRARAMLRLVLAALGRRLPPFSATDEAINCHHNYVSREAHFGAEVLVTRKGAIRARAGDLGVIPGSMGTRSYIVRGRGSAESFHSCAHGAGRRMGRNAAQKHFSVEDLIEQTKDVICRKDKGVLDEIPGAYKDIDEVMANQTDLVEVVHTLKQVICVKG